MLYILGFCEERLEISIKEIDIDFPFCTWKELSLFLFSLDFSIIAVVLLVSFMSAVFLSVSTAQRSFRFSRGFINNLLFSSHMVCALHCSCLNLDSSLFASFFTIHKSFPKSFRSA